jgi:hypothetical protein
MYQFDTEVRVIPLFKKKERNTRFKMEKISYVTRVKKYVFSKINQMNKLEQKVKRGYRIAEKTKSWFQKKKRSARPSVRN